MHKIVQFEFFYTLILHLLFDLYFISFSSRQLHTSIPILFFFNDITFFLFNISHSSPFSFSLSSLLYPLSFIFPSHLPARLSSFPYLLLVTFFSHIILSPSFPPHSHFFFPLYYSFPILPSSHPSPLLSAPFPPRLSRTHPYPLLSSLSPPPPIPPHYSLSGLISKTEFLAGCERLNKALSPENQLGNLDTILGSRSHHYSHTSSTHSTCYLFIVEILYIIYNITSR